MGVGKGLLSRGIQIMCLPEWASSPGHCKSRGSPGTPQGPPPKEKLRLGQRKRALRLSPGVPVPSHGPGMFSKAGSTPGGHAAAGWGQGKRGGEEAPWAGRHKAQILRPARGVRS